MTTPSIDSLESIFMKIRTKAINARTSLDGVNEKLLALELVDKEIVEVIKTVSNVITKLDDDTEANIALEKRIKVTKDTATQLLVANLQLALDSSEEFGRPALAAPLIEACQDKSIIEMSFNRAGWDSTVEVTINLDVSAGTLDEWGAAVSSVRENHGWGIDKNGNPIDPLKSSAIWRGRIFNSNEMWESTILERLSMVDSPAPYWRLLNYGSMQTLPSDKGGIGYPKQTPTMFVENTIKQITEEFKKFLSDARADLIVYRSRLITLYQELFNYRDSNTDDMVALSRALRNSIRQEFDMEIQPAAETNLVDFDEIYNKILDKRELIIEKMAVGLGKPYLAKNIKFAAAVIDMLEFNGKVITYKVTKDKRLEVTEKGQSRERVSVNRMQKLFQGL